MARAATGGRVVKRLLGAVALVVALLVLALPASALLDRPAKTFTREVVVSAPKARVWQTLTDFDAYEQWNPYITRAQGEARAGSTIDLRIEPPGEEAIAASAEVLIVRTKRKLEWQRRRYLPGVLDLESTFRLFQLGGGHVRVVYHGRYEGLLAPLSEHEAAARGVKRMLEALKRRVEDKTDRIPM
jgi:hypothetical protein